MLAHLYLAHHHTKKAASAAVHTPPIMVANIISCPDWAAASSTGKAAQAAPLAAQHSARTAQHALRRKWRLVFLNAAKSGGAACWSILNI